MSSGGVVLERLETLLPQSGLYVDQTLRQSDNFHVASQHMCARSDNREVHQLIAEAHKRVGFPQLEGM